MFAHDVLHDLWSLAGWTMVHFLWLGAIVAAFAFAGRVVLRNAAPNTRYTFALACLILITAMPLAAAWLSRENALASAPTPNLPPTTPAPQNTPTPISPPTTITPPLIELHTPSPLSTTSPNLPALDPRPSTLDPPPPSTLDPQPSTIWPSTLDPRLSTLVCYLPWLWLIGTPLTFALLFTGLIGTRRLSRASTPLTAGPIADALARLTASLRITRRVTVAVCERVAAPVLIGIVRPMILLPPAALTGWSPDEIEMVLLHELAHIRRYDNVVNLAQRIIESLLFFHPAVWLISTWVRREREACCDAAVVTRTQQPHAYATLLVNLAAQVLPSPSGRAQLVLEPSPSGRGQGEGAPRIAPTIFSTASPMAAGPLRTRIRHILQLEDDPMLITPKSLAITLATLLTAATLAFVYLPKIGQAEPSATEATENTEKAKISDVERAKQIAQTQNNLKNIMLQLLNYEATKKHFPAHAKYGPDGEPLLSWRVEILPFIDRKLYDEFHHDEPWDSAHNRQLIARMPAVFKNPKIDKPGFTNYLAVVGKECVFDGTPRGIRVAQITDGTSKTIALVEANADLAVEWTKPQDWSFDRAAPTKGLGQLWGDGWYAAFFDGSIRHIDDHQTAYEVGIYFTRNGREVKSLKESANYVLNSEGGNMSGPGMSEGEPGDGVSGEGHVSARFPSLEDQKLADLAWKRLGLELESIAADDLQRVKALGYDGGVKVTAGSAGVSEGGGFSGNPSPRIILPNDIIVGLHVWPTTNLKDIATILNRDDLAELNPLKFYVVRSIPEETGRVIGPDRDTVVTGRVNVQLAARPQPAPPALAPRASQPAPPPLAPRSSPLAPPTTLRYDGKPFEEWRSVWKTELSTEKRIEAVKALAAFGRAGYGPEATAAILDVAGEYDFFMRDSSAEEKLKEAVLAELAPDDVTQILAPHWVPDVAARFKKEPNKWIWLACHLLNRLRTDDKAVLTIVQGLGSVNDDRIRGSVIGALVRAARASNGNLDENSRKLIDESLESKDPQIVRAALVGMMSYPRLVIPMDPQSALHYQPASLPKLLFHADADVRLQARSLLPLLDDKATADLVDQLIAILKDPARERDHFDAIRACAVLGKKAAKATPALADTLKSSDDQPTLVATMVALARIVGRIAQNIPHEIESPQGAIKYLGIELTNEECHSLQVKFGSEDATKRREFLNAVIREEQSVVPIKPANVGGGGFY